MAGVSTSGPGANPGPPRGAGAERRPRAGRARRTAVHQRRRPADPGRVPRPPARRQSEPGVRPVRGRGLPVGDSGRDLTFGGEESVFGGGKSIRTATGGGRISTGCGVGMDAFGSPRGADVGKAQMVNNDALPVIEIDAETHGVTVDGTEIRPAPAETLPLAQLYAML